MKNLSLNFLRWGAAFLLLGLSTGYGPFHHYLYSGTDPSCPAAPIHAHVILLGWVGMTLFGLVYRALPGWAEPDALSKKLASAHLWLSVISVLGVWGNGGIGYGYLNSVSPGFYYVPDQETLRLWFYIDGGFLTLFLVGSVLFVIAFFRTVGFRSPRPSARNAE